MKTLTSSTFAHVTPYAGDPILSLNETFGQDSRVDKVNLGIGVYLDETGRLPTMAAVNIAEAQIAKRAASKPYLPMGGSAQYQQLSQELVFGAGSEALRERRVASIQTLGGSGAVRIGADFLKHVFPESSVWVSDPTWENHIGLFGGCGFQVNTYPYYDKITGGIDLANMLATLASLPRNSIVVFHACCHNHTGLDPSAQEWKSILALVKQNALLPFIDMAYQGFGDGLEQDAHLPRTLADAGVTFLVANSYSKNFSLYGERCGALSVHCQNAEEATRVHGQLQAAVRRNYSSPPMHGAAIVTEILSDSALRDVWASELDQMRQRIKQVRVTLRAQLEQLLPDKDFAYITRQCGMFSYTGLTLSQVRQLRSESAIYLLDSGRACLTGFTPNNIDRVAQAMAHAIQPRLWAH